MSNVKISELPASTAVNSADTVIVNQSGTTKRATYSIFQFLNTGTSAVTRTIFSKLNDVYSAKDFGATGDGVTNDTAALDLAFAQTGKIIYLPAGNYICSTALAVPTCLGIVGDGWIYGTGEGTVGTTLSVSGSVGLDLQSQRCKIVHDLWISCGTSTDIGIAIGNSAGGNDYTWNYGRIYNVRVSNATKAGARGMFLRQANFCHFYDILLDNNTINLECDLADATHGTLPADCNFYNLHLRSAGSKNLEIYGGNILNFFGMKSNSSAGVGINVSPDSSAFPPRTVIVNFYEPAFEVSVTNDVAVTATGSNNAYVSLIHPETDGVVRFIKTTGANAYARVDDLNGTFNASADSINAITNSTITVTNWGATNPAAPQLNARVTATGGGAVNSPHIYKQATLTATGMTTSPTGTLNYTIDGNKVTAYLPVISGTSNATTFTLTGLPAEITPASNKDFICGTQDNGGSIVAALGRAGSNSVITLWVNVSGNAFTASGTKSVAAMSFQYLLNP